MALWLYAVCEPGAAHARAAKQHGLRLLDCDGLCAAVGEHDDRAAHVTENEIWRHEQAVEALAAAGPVLPARFGSRLEDEDGVRRLLHERVQELRARLRWIAGAQELAVRARLEQPRPAERKREGEASGAAYIARIQERERAGAALAQRLHAALAPIAKEGRIQELPGVEGTVRGAYLVADERVADFRQAVDRLARAEAHASITCTGPWPPYSFVEQAEDR